MTWKIESFTDIGGNKDQEFVKFIDLPSRTAQRFELAVNGPQALLREHGWNTVDAMGISRSRALHAGQEYEYLAPLYVGDVLTGLTTLVAVTEKEGRSGNLRFLVLETRFTRGGAEVAVVRNKVVERLGKAGA